ncbi:MAG TPA: flagellar basal body rod protein FlgB [Stellaceae bacterium]|nr:flagellar basal body rod protein FlgB [Stellaceae bacterium]
MTAAIDTGLEFLRQVLALRGYRQQILSADIANASTPGFKAVDLDFQQALGAATGGANQPQAARLWLVDDPRQLPMSTGGAPAAAATAVKYQADVAVTLDGNSVNLDREKAAAAENAVQYEAAGTFASQILRMLTTAVGGSGAQASGGS